MVSLREIPGLMPRTRLEAVCWAKVVCWAASVEFQFRGVKVLKRFDARGGTKQLFCTVLSG